jgi:hypothetical protein
MGWRLQVVKYSRRRCIQEVEPLNLWKTRAFLVWRWSPKPLGRARLTDLDRFKSSTPQGERGREKQHHALEETSQPSPSAVRTQTDEGGCGNVRLGMGLARTCSFLLLSEVVGFYMTGLELLHDADELVGNGWRIERLTCWKRGKRENRMRWGKIFAVLNGASRKGAVTVVGDTQSIQR